MRIVAQPKDPIATFVALRTGNADGWRSFTALGLVGRKGLVAGVVYSRWTAFDVHVTLALNGRAIPMFLFAAFDYPFNQVGVRRLTALTKESNEASVRLAQHLGFVQEGRLRKGAGAEDLLLWGMLREECKWISREFYDRLALRARALSPERSTFISAASA